MTWEDYKNKRQGNNTSSQKTSWEQYKQKRQANATQNTVTTKSSTKNKTSLWNNIKNIAGNVGRVADNLKLGGSSGLKQALNFSFITVDERNKTEQQVKNQRILGSKKLSNSDKAMYIASQKSTPTIKNTAKLPTIELPTNQTYDKEKVEDIANYSVLDKAIQEDQKKIQENIEQQTNGVSRKLAELAPSIGNMAVGAAASAIAPSLGTTYFVTSAGGSYMQDALDRGMSRKEAIKYGKIMGAMEGATEAISVGTLSKAGKGLKALIKGSGKEIIKGGTEEIAKNSLKNVLKDYGIGIAENAIQEAIIEPIQEVTAGQIGGKDKANWNDIGQRMLKSGIDGGLTSAILGGANLGIESCIGVVEKAQNGRNVTEQELKNAVKDASKQLDVEKMVTDSVQQELTKYKTSSRVLQSTQNAQNTPSQQVVPMQQENAQNGISEQVVKRNIIDEKVNEYIKQNRNNFNSNINLSTDVVNKTNETPINYKVQNQGTIYKKARELFSKVNKKVFKNANQDIYVTNGDIRESIEKTLKNPEQRKQINENLAVFSQLDKIIENGKKISSSELDNKGRNEYADYEYYVSNAYIDGKPYVVEFDTRLQKGESRKQERHFRLERVYNINEVGSKTGATEVTSQIGIEPTSIITNSIPQNTKNVNGNTTGNYSMQESENNSGSLQQPYRTSEEIARDNEISDLEAIKEDSNKINTPSKQVAQQTENSIKEKTSNQTGKSPTIDFVKKKRSKEKASIKEIKDILAQKFVNKGHYIDKLAKETGNRNLTYLYDRTMNVFTEAQVCIGDHQVNANGEVIGKSIIDIFKPAEEANLSTEFDDYLLNKHNISRYAHEKGIFGKEITATYSQKIVEDYDAKYPEFKKWAKEVSQYNDNNLKELVNNGLVTQETYNLLREMYGDYVPTYRDITDNVQQYSDDNVGGNTLKTATQSDKSILSVAESMAEQTIAIKKAIRINNLGIQLYKTLGKDSKVLSGISYDPLSIQSLQGDVIAKATDGSNDFTIFQDGEMTQFKISDEIYTAFQNDTLQNKINNNDVAKALLTPLEKLSKGQRELLTTYNIGFALNNPIKDIQDALFNTKYNTKTFAKNYIKALYNIGTKGSWYESYKNNGGTANTYFDYNKGILPTNTKNPIAKFGNAIKKVNNILEQAPRLAEYISTIEHKGSIEEALYNASEITVNFKRGGDITKVVNKYGANFLNASVQGLDKFYRNLTGQSGWKGYANLAVKATIWQITPAIINGLLLGDDDDYEDLPEYTKDNYFLFKIDDGKFFRIPKGRVSSIIGGIARRALETVEGKDVDWGSLVDTVINQMAPNNPLTDNIIAPIKQAIDNETWYGGEIVGSRLKSLPNVEQYDESTDELSKWVAKQVDKLPTKTKETLVNLPIINKVYDIVSTPKKLNYVIDQYGAGISDIALPIMTPQAENNILEDKFTTDSVMKNKNVSKYYSQIEELEKAKNSANATDEDILKYKYFTSYSKDINELYKQKREIQNSEMLDIDKREAVREVQQKINNLVEEKLNTVENIQISGDTAQVGNSKYYKYKGEWKEVTAEEQEKIGNISLKTYADYQNKVYAKTQSQKASGELKDNQSLKNKDKIEILLNSKYSNSEIAAIYENYIKSSTDTEYNIMKATGIDIKEYLKYKQQEFTSDKTDDGTLKGKTVSKSEQKKVVEYLNSNIKNGNQRLLLYAMREYSMTTSQKTQLANYVNGLKLDKDTKLKLYDKFSGFTVYKDGTVKW